jgi:hypothetical protein
MSGDKKKKQKLLNSINKLDEDQSDNRSDLLEIGSSENFYNIEQGSATFCIRRAKFKA